MNFTFLNIVPKILRLNEVFSLYVGIEKLRFRVMLQSHSIHRFLLLKKLLGYVINDKASNPSYILKSFIARRNHLLC